MAVTSKLPPRVSKTPDADFSPEFDPAYENDIDTTMNGRTATPRVQPQATSGWTPFWAALIIIAAGIVAYGYYNSNQPVAPVITNETSTTVTPPVAPVTPPKASTAAPDATTTPPPAAATTPPAAPAVTPPATTTAP